MKFFYMVLISVFISPQSFSEIKEKDISRFFEQYIKEAKEFDKSLIELYSDTAKITTNRVSLDGTVVKMELDGIKYKQLLKTSLGLAKKRGDVSDYSDVRISIESGRAKINAIRYSKLKCSIDPEFQMELIPKGKDFSIIKEHSLTYAFSKCKVATQVTLSNLLNAEVIRYKPYLGKMIDADTRLDKIEVIGNTLFWISTLIDVPVSEFTPEEIKNIMKPILVKQTCTMQNFNKILENNGIVTYTYLSKEGEKINSIPIANQDCSN